jgi:hypothetical protein
MPRWPTMWARQTNFLGLARTTKLCISTGRGRTAETKKASLSLAFLFVPIPQFPQLVLLNSLMESKSLNRNLKFWWAVQVSNLMSRQQQCMPDYVHIERAPT